MVAHLIGLKLAILRNSVRRSTAQLIGMIFGALYGLAILALMIVGLIGLAFVPLEISRTVIVLAGAALILAWLIVPLFTSGLDMTLDPSALLPLRCRCGSYSPVWPALQCSVSRESSPSWPHWAPWRPGCVTPWPPSSRCSAPCWEWPPACSARGP